MFCASHDLCAVADLTAASFALHGGRVSPIDLDSSFVRVFRNPVSDTYLALNYLASL